MVKVMPECGAHGDCFANHGGWCVCLSDNDFSGRDCPFYKPADMFCKERRREECGGAAYGNQQI